MDTRLTIDFGESELFSAEAVTALREAGIEVQAAEGDAGALRTRGAASAADVIVALGSGGAFSALYQALAAVLARNKEREIQIERGGVKVTLKGHNLEEEKDLLARLFPEFAAGSEEDEGGGTA